MKKIVALILMLVGLVGCSGKKDIKVKLDYEEMPSAVESSAFLYTKFKLLSKELNSLEEYDEKINNKDSFLMFVYLESCYGCKLLAPAIKSYIDENPLVIYTMSYSVIEEKHDLYKQGVNTTPFLILVEDGKIVYKELGELPEDKNEHVNWVENWMEKHVEWSEQ